MKSLSVPSSRYLKAGVFSLLAAAWLAAGCSNDGGIGDGVYIDPASLPGGASNTAPSSNSKGGATSSNAGAPARGGASGFTGVGGASGGGGAGGAGGSAGRGGSTGSAGTAGGPVGTGGSIGTSGSGGTTGMSGAAGKGAGGSSAGGGSLLCGNGKVDTGEACDSSNLLAGGSGGGGSGGLSGGGGETTSSGGFPTVAPQYGQLCSNTCFKIGTPDCLNCEVGDEFCGDWIDNCLGPEEARFDVAQQTACYAVMRCVQQSNCFDGTNTLGRCYCGSLDTTACGNAPFSGAGSPDGACVAEIKAGFPTFKMNSQVLGSFSARTFPSGAAGQRLNCQKNAHNSACSAACGFTSGGPAFP